MNVPVKRLKAFTVFELIITMTVTSILIAVIISMFFRFNEFLTIRKVQIENNSELLLFMQELSDDFDLANQIFYDNQKLVLITVSDIKNTYFFENGIVKKLTLQKLKIFNVPISKIEIHYYNENTKLLDDIYIYVEEILSADTYLYLKKRYSKKKMLSE